MWDIVGAGSYGYVFASNTHATKVSVTPRSTDASFREAHLMSILSNIKMGSKYFPKLTNTHCDELPTDAVASINTYAKQRNKEGLAPLEPGSPAKRLFIQMKRYTKLRQLTWGQGRCLTGCLIEDIDRNALPIMHDIVGWIHGDLCLNNIVFDEDSKNFVLIDFSVSKERTMPPWQGSDRGPDRYGRSPPLAPAMWFYKDPFRPFHLMNAFTVARGEPREPTRADDHCAFFLALFTRTLPSKERLNYSDIDDVDEKVCDRINRYSELKDWGMTIVSDTEHGSPIHPRRHSTGTKEMIDGMDLYARSMVNRVCPKIGAWGDAKATIPRASLAIDETASWTAKEVDDLFAWMLGIALLTMRCVVDTRIPIEPTHTVIRVWARAVYFACAAMSTGEVRENSIHGNLEIYLIGAGSLMLAMQMSIHTTQDSAEYFTRKANKNGVVNFTEDDLRTVMTKLIPITSSIPLHIHRHFSHRPRDDMDTIDWIKPTIASAIPTLTGGSGHASVEDRLHRNYKDVVHAAVSMEAINLSNIRL